MALSNDVLKEFAKVTKPVASNQPSYQYGTVTGTGTTTLVRLNGSQVVTPCESTMDVKIGDTVLVMVKDHTAILTNDATNLAATTNTVQNSADAVYNSVTANFGSFKYLEANYAKLETLESDYATIDTLNNRYADIKMLNVETETVKDLFVHNGIIKDAVISEGRITGVLDAVTVNADSITTGTLRANRLEILGKDGLFYRLNTDGATVEAQQTTQNALDGSHIIAKSITATKIAVNDLVAFNATIGGIQIKDQSIKSMNGKFEVTSAGALTATSGKIGGFSIGDTALIHKETSKSSDVEYEITYRLGEGAGSSGDPFTDGLSIATTSTTSTATATRLVRLSGWEMRFDHKLTQKSDNKTQYKWSMLDFNSLYVAATYTNGKSYTTSISATGIYTPDIALSGGSYTLSSLSTFLQTDLYKKIYPVGAIYISTSSTSPATLFGGTWVRIENRFLLAAGSSYSAGATGGSANATLVSHSHTFSSGKAADNGVHVHSWSGGLTNDAGGHTHAPSNGTSYGFMTYKKDTVSRVKVSTSSGSKYAIVGNVTTSAAASGVDYGATTASSGTHNHKVTLAITEAGKHGHTVTGTISTQGSSATGANMPPYIAVYVWKRTA